MTTVSIGAQVFDLAFHPTDCTAYACTMSGQVKAISYDYEGRHKESFSVSLSQRSCRGLTINDDGSKLFVVGKGKAIHTIDTLTAKVSQTRTKAHDSPINRVKHLTPWLFATGDDDGVIKLWDPRTKDVVRKYTQHFDYITDFLWLEDKKQLVATSGDGTVSVMDVRSKKTEPFAQSEDQEDELLSIAPIKGSTKVIIGMQSGVLSVFNRSSGWGDCVDRIPGHPQSVDTMCSLPESLPDVDVTSTILTGSSDGIVRAVQVFPTKLLGVVADHGEWPIEKVVVGEGIHHLTLEDEDEGGDDDDDEDEIVSKAEKVTSKTQKVTKDGDEEGEEEEEEEDDQATSSRWWVGSVGHDENLMLTNLHHFFRPGRADVEEADLEPDGATADGAGAPEDDAESGSESASADELDARAAGDGNSSASDDGADNSDSDADSEPEPESEPEPVSKKRKQKPEKNPLAVKRKKGKNTVDVEGQFFDEL